MRAVNMMRAHVVAADMYSAEVDCVPNEALASTRTIVRSATSAKARGRSAYVDMLHQKARYADLAFDTSILPLIELATRINIADYERRVVLRAAGPCDPSAHT